MTTRENSSRICAAAMIILLTSCGGGGGGGGDVSGPAQGPGCPAPVRIDPDSVTNGSLASGDCTIARLFPSVPNDQSLVDQYIVTLPVSGRLMIRLESFQFDSYLFLLDSPAALPPIAEDDDGGGGLDSMIVANLAAGDYIIVANSFSVTAATGDYTLTTTFFPDTWSPVTMNGAPEPRTDHSAVWTGTEMIVWGGDDANSITKDNGGRYDPASDSWTPTSTTGSPAPREQHTAVWTGSEMIVWGGFTGAFDFLTLGDGAGYAAATDSWSPVSSIDAPSPRVNHTAVWTGTEMLVWGGFSCLACANGEVGDGARYDPATDTWTQISNVNAPPARGHHTTVWTGAEMIVWGGQNEGGVGSLTMLDSGGIYDPATDTWTSITTTGAPAARRCHIAVWTGAEMIVYGGQTDPGLACSISSVMTGGRYDPATDSWRTISNSPLNSTLSGPSGIWSGDRLITWFDNMGARYDPVTDLWQGVSTDGAPSARRKHTIVWTGTNVIIWGGQFAGALGDGAVYDPRFDPTP